MSKIIFNKLTSNDKSTIFSWLEEPHVKEFWDNSKEHKEDIVCFVEGRKTLSDYCDGKYDYWIACCDNEPYAMIMSIQETQEDDIDELKKSHLSQTGSTYGLDFMIGNIKFLGKGYGAETLKEFIRFFKSSVDPSVRLFITDPAADNPKALRVYEKAGFAKVGEFVPEGPYSGAGKPHLLLVKNV